MKTTFNFGKIDYHGRGAKHNEVEVTVELKIKKLSYDKEDINHHIWKAGDEYLVVSICGDIWNKAKTEIECCGQCLDEIAKHLPRNKLFKYLYSIWKKYHLNDARAGCVHQAGVVLGSLDAADQVCEKGYRYGSEWLLEPIPHTVTDQLQALINANNLLKSFED